MKPENNDKEMLNAPNKSMLYFYLALVAAILGVAFTVLTFVTVLGVYALIAAIVLYLASLAFLRVQKKKNNFKWVKPLTIAVYVLLAIDAVIFIVGIIIVMATTA